MKLAPCLLAVALGLGCGDSHDPEIVDAGMDSMSPDSGPSEVDAGPPAFPPERALATRGSCERIAGYEINSSEEPALLWSYAHTFIRSFGDHASPWAIDAHLVAALSEDLQVGVVNGEASAFGTYAELVPSTCYADHWSLPGDVFESTREDLQWLRPGSPISLSGEPIILDLRNVPEGPTLRAFLTAFAEATLGDVGAVRARYRSFTGQPDEGFLEQLLPGTPGLYQGNVGTGVLEPIRGSNDSETPIGILFGQRVAPSAARFALALRLDGRAAILGESLPVGVAEREVATATGGGLFTRVFEILGDEALPDAIDADIPGDDPLSLESAFLAFDAATLEPIQGESSRGEFRDITRTNRVVASDRGEASRQAAVVILHGVSQRFFPYWDVVDTAPDERLMGALALEYRDDVAEEYGAPAEEYFHLIRSIRYFAHSLKDSHVTPFLADGAAAIPDLNNGTSEFLPVDLDHTAEGYPIVRATASADFALGDVIQGIDGRPILDYINESLEFSSSSESSRMRNGVALLRYIFRLTTFQVRSADGTVRDVEVGPVAGTEQVSYQNRERGPLDDIGHPELYYIDLSAEAMRGSNPTTLHRTLQDYEGLVLDMRGYPGPGSWAFIAGLMPDGGPGPQMEQVYQGPDTRRVEALSQPTARGDAGFDGPVVVLTAPTTQSQAEHLTLTLTAAGRAEVVGRPSAGANGNITSVALPGGFGATFTGLIVLQNDGSTFHGVGVPVDHPVEILPEDLAAGIDPELQHAAELLAL